MTIVNTSLPVGYQQANCHNLSHFICMLLESKGIITSKIWAFSPGIYSNSNSQLITFIDKKELSPNGTIDWGYHVAPVLNVNDGIETHQMVIDLGLFPNGLVHYKTWLDKLKTKKLISLMLDFEWYLFNSTMIPNSQLKYDANGMLNSKLKNIILPETFSDKLIDDFYKYTDDSQQNQWLEKGLAINATAVEFYTVEIAPLLKLNNQTQLINDYKNLVGNVFNFETVFRDNRWNYDMTTDFQKQYFIIINKYREIYNNNLIKWGINVANLKNIIDSKKI
tara:strand:+ start:3063 stop:3899 length:837 start_codon:yes stop_codon:yes gene_type:complete